jgi:pyruvate,water dikinase
LNHRSIVARELGVPAIVGVCDASTIIQEGTELTLDGGLGIINLERTERN